MENQHKKSMLLLQESVPITVKERVLRHLDGPQKLVLRQVNRSLTQIIDLHRSSQEERKASNGFGQEYGQHSDDSGQSGENTHRMQVMTDLKSALLNPHLSKKNFTQAPESIKHLKQTILKFRTNMVAKSDQNALIVKTSVFEVPREVWRSGFNAFQMGNNEVVSFDEYARQRENPDFVRDFNSACGNQAHMTVINTVTQDQVHVNKGFLDSMFFDQNIASNDSDEESKYAFLASQNCLSAEMTDFSDPASIMRRQRLILEQIKEHKSSKIASFDPLKLLRRTSTQVQVEEDKEEQKNQSKESQQESKPKDDKGFLWTLILCHGGKFVVQVFQDLKCVYSGSDSKYVIRQKSGGRQCNADRTKKIMSSVGSQMRRENERLLQEHIDEFMEEVAELLKQSKVVYLHAPGENRMIFTSKSGPLYQYRNKVKSVHFQNKKANHTEATELSKRLTEVKLVFNTTLP